MSMMICEECERLVDTDYDLDGIWTETGYICEACTERAEEQAEMLAAENEQPQERDDATV